jgi:hypothetical protein
MENWTVDLLLIKRANQGQSDGVFLDDKIA